MTTRPLRKTLVGDNLGVDSRAEFGSEQQAKATHFDNVRHRGQRSRQTPTCKRCACRSVDRFHDVEHGQRSAARERLPAERRTMVTPTKGCCDLLARPTRADRHTVAEGFGQRHDIRSDTDILGVVMFIAEPSTGTREAGLHLVDDQEDLMFIAQLPDGAEVSLRHHVQSAFTLDRLEQNCADALIECGAERFGVSERDMTKPRRKRLKRLVFARLACRGKRRQRATVK